MTNAMRQAVLRACYDQLSIRFHERKFIGSNLEFVIGRWLISPASVAIRKPGTFGEFQMTTGVVNYPGLVVEELRDGERPIPDNILAVSKSSQQYNEIKEFMYEISVPHGEFSGISWTHYGGIFARFEALLLPGLQAIAFMYDYQHGHPPGREPVDFVMKQISYLFATEEDAILSGIELRTNPRLHEW